MIKGKRYFTLYSGLLCYDYFSFILMANALQKNTVCIT